MKPSSVILASAALLAVAASFFLGWDNARKVYQNPSAAPDTVYKVKWIHDTIPAPNVEPSKPKIVYLPVAVHDSTAVHDTTTVHDSVLVEVPIVEKIYVGSNYKATIRGYEPELVDIWIRQKEATITVPYRKRWSFTVGPQVGYGVTPKGCQPYAGIGATFGYSF